uniref:TRAF-interacting protein n=1 Tax=Iconisemion striatum TaxID=60296 RepID=A0A1A7YFV1_9TELE
MPIRAYCTICSDFFDHCRDVAAIQCGHTFHYECLLQWFQTAPTKTCPQCRRQVSTRHIINKLFFDIGGEEEGSADPESLQNEIDRMRALLSSKERDWQDKQKVIDGLKNTVDKQRRDLDSVRKEIIDKEMLCTALKFGHVVTGDEVESMVTDMGVSQASVEQLSIYCISLKKEYDNLKVNLKSSNDMCEKLKREVLSSNTKLQKAAMEVNQTKEDKKSLQKDLSNADKEISSLKKKVEFLQKTLSTPTRTNEALSRLVFESPAPLELKPPRLHHSTDVEEVDLNATYDITTPDHVTSRPAPVPHKKICLDPLMTSISKLGGTGSSVSKAQGEEPLSIPVFRNSLLFRKKTLGSMLDPQRKAGAVRTGYDGLGGRTKFIQPSPLAEIRPLVRTKRKKVTRRPNTISSSLTLDGFFQ